MKIKNKTLIIISSILILGFTISNGLINLRGQANNTLFVTVSVEANTTDRLPNITGTCAVGGIMIFTIKKGNSGTLSESITQECIVSPYSLKPTIQLPEGKYKVEVEIFGQSVG
jgi:hypothetical protein